MQWEGMRDVGSARYEQALLPLYQIVRVLSYSNCQRSTRYFLSEFSETRKFTCRASKRRCVLFVAVWREPGVIIRRVLFAAGWREPGVVCYHI